ncbi:uncharacterized protein LOC116619311 isoform X2 [Nematostella vectensis]|uniref:uncharacterized protein LOC116619311 isoform X2 n=1 Tax=Nematostella vectensis TaxID=45351 RepID=UPI002076F694|nr:uncharacterized protein LOC116619311 isoform X2 [Nematostella vectensis]
MSFAYSRLKSPCPDKRSPFSVLRFVLFGERCLEIKRNVCGLMGALHSAIEQGKQRRKAKKRLVERKIAIAREYSRTLDDELERAERHLNVLLDTSDVTSCSSATLSGCTTVTLCASLQSLVSEMDSGVSIEEVNTPDELSDETVSLIMESRCDKLDDNLRASYVIFSFREGYWRKKRMRLLTVWTGTRPSSTDCT